MSILFSYTANDNATCCLARVSSMNNHWWPKNELWDPQPAVKRRVGSILIVFENFNYSVIDTVAGHRMDTVEVCCPMRRGQRKGQAQPIVSKGPVGPINQRRRFGVAFW